MTLTSKIGRQNYFNLLAKLDRIRIRHEFKDLLKETKISYDIQRILLELLIVSIQEEFEFGNDHFGEILFIWNENVTVLPRECRFSGAKELSEEEKSKILQAITIVVGQELFNGFFKKIRLDISNAPYKVTYSEVEVEQSSSYLATPQICYYQHKLFPQNRALKK